MTLLQSLYESIRQTYKLKLVSGKNGLNKAVSWTYHTDDYSTINFIRGGELAITTGKYFENDMDHIESGLKGLISQLNKLNACGLVINTGKYINEIPDSIIEYADSIGFALFDMPWEIHIIDMTQDIGNRIVKDNQKCISLSDAVEASIFKCKEIPQDIIEKHPFMQMAENTKYMISLISLHGEFLKLEEEVQKHYIEYHLNTKLDTDFDSFCWFIHENFIVYVFKGDCDKIIRHLSKILPVIFSKDSKFKDSRIAFSNAVKNFYELQYEFDHAKKAFALCREQICNYNTLGIYKIFSRINNLNELSDFYNEILGKLEVLGTEKKKDYLNTLKLYLESSGRIQKTAQENYTHRNTVNYRIKKMVELLGVDLTDGRTRYLIQTALYIREYLELINGYPV